MHCQPGPQPLPPLPIQATSWARTESIAARCGNGVQKPLGTPPLNRAAPFERAADFTRTNYGEFLPFDPRSRKTLLDCVAELREAVDFLALLRSPSPPMRRLALPLHLPWNFPLPFITGQMAPHWPRQCRLAKPAEQTPLMAHRGRCSCCMPQVCAAQPCKFCPVGRHWCSIDAIRAERGGLYRLHRTALKIRQALQTLPLHTP